MSLDPKTYRSIMGAFATGVTVITTDVDGMLHGMTANAVTSVSLDPMLLLVCVDKGAQSHVQLQKTRTFGVNILSSEQKDVSNTFAVSAPPEEGALRGVAWHEGVHATPLLDGALATLECRVTKELDGGDHTIFLGEVLEGVAPTDAAPLLFFRGAYRFIS